MTAENLINELTKEVERLTREFEQAQKDIKDFENLALIWKKSYLEMERNYKIKLSNVEQVIEQLEKELKESRS